MSRVSGNIGLCNFFLIFLFFFVHTIELISIFNKLIKLIMLGRSNFFEIMYVLRDVYYAFHFMPSILVY